MNSIVSNMFVFLENFFGSPVPLLLVIIAKIFFGQKFKNKIFWALFSIFFLTLSFLFIIAAIFLQNGSKIPPLSFMEKMNILLAPFAIWGGETFEKCFIYILPIILVAVLIYFIRTKDKSVFKKTTIMLVLLSPFAYISYPFFVMDIKKRDITSIEYRKYMAENAIPPIKAYNASWAADAFEYDYIAKYFNKGKNPDNSSEEAKSLIDNYLKYKKIETSITGYDYGYLYMLRITEKFEELANVIEKIEKRAGKKIFAELDLYIAKKDYVSALATVESIDFQDIGAKYIYYTKIYAGLKKYDKAYEYLDKCNKVMHQRDGKKVYNITKLYLDYKTGKPQLAKDEFKTMSPFIQEKFTLDEYIKSLERVDY